MALRSSAPTFSIGVVALLLAELLELLAAGVLVFDEALGEAAVLDVLEQALHGLLDFRR